MPGGARGAKELLALAASAATGGAAYVWLGKEQQGGDARPAVEELTSAPEALSTRDTAGTHSQAAPRALVLFPPAGAGARSR